MTELFDFVLPLGDDALVAAARMAEWCARAPQLEEDVALANITLDLLGQARELLTYAGQVENAGRDEDELAYLRDQHEFRNVQLVELPNGDFATTIAKSLFLSTYQHLLYERLSRSTDARLAGIAASAVKAARYHVDHAAHWTVCLGAGTAESHRRMQAAVDEVWPFTHELFEAVSTSAGLTADGTAVEPGVLLRPWTERIGHVLDEATLSRPEDGWMPTGGRHGVHTEAFGYLVAEMQSVHRAHPGAHW